MEGGTGLSDTGHAALQTYRRLLNAPSQRIGKPAEIGGMTIIRRHLLPLFAS